jgi:GDP-4-dehydro-6-deoxy-D-mannose reductase
MRRALVTGHAGFVGQHLSDVLKSFDYSVSGFGLSEGGDIRDPDSVADAVQSSHPDVVFHLAGATKPTDFRELYSVNVMGTAVLLDAIVQLARQPVVVLASSSAVYGHQDGGQPISERARTRPVTHYGASKLSMEVVARRYAQAHGLRVLCVRAFNVLGPGMPISLACGAFVDAIVRIEQSGSNESIRTGNLASSRDFTDVRDVARAYALLSEHGRGGAVYNVCSGRSVTLDYCLQVLLRHSRPSIKVEADPARLQPNDLSRQIGDAKRLRRLTGWEPAIPVEQSLLDTLQHRRQESAG